MARAHTYTASKCIDILGTEIEAHYEFRVQPPEYERGFVRCPAIVENITVSLSQCDLVVECPDWLHEALCEEDGLEEWLLQEAAEAARDAALDAADLKSERQMEGRV